MSKSSTDNIIIRRKIDKNSEVVVGENYLIITKQSYTQINQELDINNYQDAIEQAIKNDKFLEFKERMIKEYGDREF
jgi:hypothetical protein